MTQCKEFKALQAEIEGLKHVNNALKEHSLALQSKLDALQTQEPVAWCEEDGMHYHPNLLINKGLKLYAAPKALEPDVDWLSNVIRQVDGNNKLGAGALAEKIVEAISAHGIGGTP